MSGDVVGGGLAAGLGEPTLGESDEDAREAPGAGRVVVVAEPAGATGEVDDDGHDQLGLDRLEEPRLQQALWPNKPADEAMKTNRP